MRAMTKEEAHDLIRDHRWTALCTVTPDGSPYAIEFSYFIMEGCICGMINPGGVTGTNLKHQPKVCLKMCRTGKYNNSYEAASVFGFGRYEDNPDLIDQAWDLLEQRLQRPKGTYARAKEKCRAGKIKAPLFMATMDEVTGVTSKP